MGGEWGIDRHSQSLGPSRTVAFGQQVMAVWLGRRHEAVGIWEGCKGVVCSSWVLKNRDDAGSIPNRTNNTNIGIEVGSGGLWISSLIPHGIQNE